MGGAALPIATLAAQVVPAVIGAFSKRKPTEQSSGLDTKTEQYRDTLMNYAMNQQMPIGNLNAQALLQKTFLPGLGEFNYTPFGGVGMGGSTGPMTPRLPVTSTSPRAMGGGQVGAGPIGITPFLDPRTAPNTGTSQTGGFRGGNPMDVMEAIRASIGTRSNPYYNPWMGRNAQ